MQTRPLQLRRSVRSRRRLGRNPNQPRSSTTFARSLAATAVTATCIACGSGGGASGGSDVTGSSLFGADNATLNGRVALPSEVPAGAAVQAGIASPGVGAAWTGSEIFSGTMRAKSNLAEFSISKLNAADYLVFLRVDADGSGSFGSGDFGGYYTDSSSPVLDPTTATVVSITAGATRLIDFDAATIP